MKLVIDATTSEYGGIRTVAEAVISAWTSVFLEDEVHVVVRSGSTLDTSRANRIEVKVPRPRVVGRPWAQTRHLHRIVREVKADAMLALLPSTTLRRVPAPVVVLVHDMRHELMPHQFSAMARVMRRLSYGRGYSVAAGVAAISQRTMDDLLALHPRLRDLPSSVSHLGCDHVQDWPAPTSRGPVVAFGHHSNKNTQLLIEAWAELVDAQPTPQLVVLGVGAQREQIEREISDRGLEAYVACRPFLSDLDFQQVIGEAAAVVFPSDFEGFGLPVLEAMAMSKPIVIGPERATIEVAGGHATVMTGWSPSELADAFREAMNRSPEQLEHARRHATGFTWRTTVDSLRRVLVEVIRQS